MKVVILCGGLGTRLREETEYKPKPMVSIGKHPILWHIMKIYSHFNHKDFILALGYKGDMIKEYFMNYQWHSSDFTLNTKTKETVYHDLDGLDEWNVTFADTGLESLTAKRLLLLKKYLKNEDNFMLTYGDGIADVEINKLIEFHKKNKKIITITGINPTGQYGVIDVDSKGIAKDFKEKPSSKDVINGGFMVINKKIFDYIDENQNYMLEVELLPKLVKLGQVSVYDHKRFWHSMDTYRDYIKLNQMHDNGELDWLLNLEKNKL